MICVLIRRHAVVVRLVVVLAVGEAFQQEVHVVWWRTEQKSCDIPVRRNNKSLLGRTRRKEAFNKVADLWGCL